MQRDPLEIYLDCNATTPVLPQARAAALSVMEEQFGNPSSVHLSGLRARSILEGTRAAAGRILGAKPERIIFTSGATEGIQVAVFSAIQEGLKRFRAGDSSRFRILYGATEHKAVPEAIRHWNEVLGAPFQVESVAVDSRGRLDLQELKAKLPETLLLCTMAVNNETGAFQDLKAIESILREPPLGHIKTESPLLWLVDCVQALGKLHLDFSKLSVDYAPFSGHKLYAMKGVGFLYVREGAPITPMTVGGGQERGLRSGTENLPGVASLGAVFELLEKSNLDGGPFRSDAELRDYSAILENALREVFPAIEFALPAEAAIPTTLNFAVPGLASRDLMDLFDAAGIRVSAGSACSSGKAASSHVLDAMGFPEWRSTGAIRLSWGLATTREEIERAAVALKRAGRALGQSCLLVSSADFTEPSAPFDGILQLRHAGANTWVIANAQERVCVVIDPVAELSDRIQQFVSCQGMRVLAVLDTHSHADHESCRPLLAQALGLDPLSNQDLGWNLASALMVRNPTGKGDFPGLILSREKSQVFALLMLSTPGHTSDSVSYLWVRAQSESELLQGAFEVRALFCGDLVLAGGLGRTDFVSSNARDAYQSLRFLNEILTDQSVLCPAHDYENTFATTWGAEKQSASSLLVTVLKGPGEEAQILDFISLKRDVDRQISGGGAPGTGVLCGLVQAVDPTEKTRLIRPGTLQEFLAAHPGARVIDVREAHEFAVTQGWGLHGLKEAPENVPLSRFVNFCAELLPHRNTSDGALVFLCRSGNRSLQAVRSLHRLGIRGLWSVEGGVALN